MLISIGIILILSVLIGMIFEKINIPKIIAYILIGVLLASKIDISLLNISPEIRKIALVIILIRAGLTLDFNVLKTMGKSSILMCFLPATIEILGTAIFAPLIFKIPVIDALILGSVIAAVSPAIVVPRMIGLINKGYSKIPQLILAGASMDDIFVITLFSIFMSIQKTGQVTIKEIINLPLSIVLAVVVAVIFKYISIYLFKFIKEDTLRIILFFSLSLIILEIEKYLPVASLLSITLLAMLIKKENEEIGRVFIGSYEKLWKLFEIFLFVLIGANLKISSVFDFGLLALLLLIIAQVFRMFGVYLSLIGDKFKNREKIFAMVAYLPKATVQAAIGVIPLANNVPSGELILTVAILSILFTAPLGAVFIDNFYEKLLQKDNLS
ncbi:cation:proton antiporter domain-containing protein [Streptobacillus canis]|uniref:cation:proton antiporter domain-containing protein n=1 Tax=Streptobacillus canis TaxID=2678686 RepID=UPI0012E0DCD6|nr:cation:proton antiporter [Streptobacillus canis]